MRTTLQKIAQNKILDTLREQDSTEGPAFFGKTQKKKNIVLIDSFKCFN